MGRYCLNGLDLVKYGFLPGHASNSNIALAGAWSLPKRLGDCYHDWHDMDGVEPFVDADDIRFAGRDLELHGTITGKNREEFLINLNGLHGLFYQSRDLVKLESEEFGEFNVYVKDIIETTYLRDGVGSVILKFREPVVDLSGELPVGTLSTGDRVDGIPFLSLGLTVTGFTGVDSRPAIKTQNFTAWENEGFLITKPKVRSLNLKMLIEAANYADFRFKIGQCYRLFGGAGVRDITINGETEALFAIDGFTVSDVIIKETVTAILEIKLLDGYILNERILCDDNTDITIGEKDELIIVYYGG